MKDSKIAKTLRFALKVLIAVGVAKTIIDIKNTEKN